jgi:hypothetical protein
LALLRGSEKGGYPKGIPKAMLKYLNINGENDDELDETLD